MAKVRENDISLDSVGRRGRYTGPDFTSSDLRSSSGRRWYHLRAGSLSVFVLVVVGYAREDALNLLPKRRRPTCAGDRVTGWTVERKRVWSRMCRDSSPWCLFKILSLSVSLVNRFFSVKRTTLKDTPDIWTIKNRERRDSKKWTLPGWNSERHVFGLCRPLEPVSVNQ